MTTTIPAIEPGCSASVSASAGTGKTWLLISRIVRLLLADAAPASILAITFTRKAAAEMRQRLSQRLHALATISAADLDDALREINAPTDSDTRLRARHLYEQLLHSHYRINITTFHAFCQDMLRRFPLEADVPPGFELIESTADLEQAAWDLLFSETTRSPDTELATNLDLLFEHCGSIYSTKHALENFLNHRSDWWAYTDAQQDSKQFTLSQLKDFLECDPEESPLDDFFNPITMQELTRFHDLLALHRNATNEKFCASIMSALAMVEKSDLNMAFTQIETVFFTGTGTPRARKQSKAQHSSMGASGETMFLELHESFVSKIEACKDTLLKIANYNLNQAWYQAGSYLLSLYQSLKSDQRLLDFADLEWKAYQLLNHSEHAHWIQYKLDMRINHLLIDEFQDTNPTQWQLIAPLLKELASEGQDTNRSVFIVGDTKQSIYRFRRADPELFNAAANWLAADAAAQSMPLSKSWRSSPAIIECVNKIFKHKQLEGRITSFTPHSTHHTNLWGRVEVIPLVVSETEENDQPGPGLFRNPLIEARNILDDTRHYSEGQLIAEKIKQLIEQKTMVGSGVSATPIRYSDIIILLKQRTHSSAYEQALRDQNIPYAGAERGTLLFCLEIRDIVALLEILITPFNDLSLATVLRSPIFNFSNQQLIQLAQIEHGKWIDRLRLLSETHDNSEFTHAYTMLHEWHSLSGTIPVHDLLDRIYSQAGIIQRYVAATPFHMQSRVKSNLIQFLELALEIDSGRYPSIGRFLLRLHVLKSQAQGAPDEKSYVNNSDYVRIMTIHAAKGLEAAVVFFADCTNTSSQAHTHQVVVRWPAHENRPSLMMLTGKKSTQDRHITQLLDLNTQAEQRENANLLYVALTRAKQCLFISGSQSKKQAAVSWYSVIREQLTGIEDDIHESVIYEFGEQRSHESIPDSINNNPIASLPAPDLSIPLLDFFARSSIAPSDSLKSSHTENRMQPKALDEIDSTADHIAPATKEYRPINTRPDLNEARIRGTIIHRILQLLTDGHSEKQVMLQLANEYQTEHDNPVLITCLCECQSIVTNNDHRHIFDKTNYDCAYNEVPIQYCSDNKSVYGIIDRLVVSDNYIYIIDYKTTVDISQSLNEIAKEHQTQLGYYAAGVKRLWPDLPLQTAILLTHQNKLVIVKEY